MSEDPVYHRGSPPKFEQAPFEPTEAFSWAFGLWREEPQRVALPLVVLSFVLVTTATVVPALLSGLVGLLSTPETVLAAVLRGVAHLLSAGINLFVGAHVFSAAYPFVLNVARGRPVVFADLFRYQHLLPRTLVLYFVISFAMSVGMMFCVLPGVFCMVATSMAMPLLIDQELTPWVALQRSWALAQRQLVPLLVFCLFCLVAVIAGLLLCFAPAVLVSIPVVLLAQAYVYLRLMGENPINA